MSEPMVILKDIHKCYGDNEVLKGVTLEIAKGDVVTLMGPSGTGKTTLLRCINLLERPETGSITIDGETIQCGKLSAREMVHFRRNTAMVFQHYNLLKNQTVLENVTEGLIVVQKMKPAEAKRLALEELAKVGMADKQDAYPSEISGGQQQRVGIARALALRPKVILLDEPTSALDPELVGEVLDIIQAIAKTGITMVIVTHEMKFARNVSNRVVLMEGGHIVEQGSPEQAFEHPTQERTRQFLERIMK